MLNKGVNSSMTDKIAEIKHRFDHETAKRTLKEKYEAKMLFAQYGGMWRAGPVLINILNASYNEILYLEDEYGNPCKVPRHKLLTEVQERWQEQMNAWSDEFNKMQKIR